MKLDANQEPQLLPILPDHENVFSAYLLPPMCSLIPTHTHTSPTHLSLANTLAN